MEVDSTHIGGFILEWLHPQSKVVGPSSKSPTKFYKETPQGQQKGKFLELKNMIFATFCSLVYAYFWMPNLVSYVMELDASCCLSPWWSLRRIRVSFRRKGK